ncbi:FliM/FliN family flagellar motor switch protein [Lacisediminimonas sp.]|uniref:FliM/FliN family flagellar motor switch protein n=1 Tax=Lacisediminimonas sp. TaxID=3060582 RepID=UPI0027266889|nr:FliM/FliN family flagellar motor switch protein [Lacisediminimonas sp.]MDO8299554.1 FliM/FliN family flagellar motor switch protein [Lacisediminimonas sp.]
MNQTSPTSLAEPRADAEPVDVQPVRLQALPPSAAGGPAMFSNGLGLVGNVRVRVRAVIGEAELSIAELFALKQGASLKLDVAANAPIDLYLEDRLIARGALVVVDDNFGLQITQIEVEHEIG